MSAQLTPPQRMAAFPRPSHEGGRLVWPWYRTAWPVAGGWQPHRARWVYDGHEADEEHVALSTTVYRTEAEALDVLNRIP